MLVVLRRTNHRVPKAHRRSDSGNLLNNCVQVNTCVVSACAPDADAVWGCP